MKLWTFECDKFHQVMGQLVHYERAPLILAVWMITEIMKGDKIC